MDYFLLKQTRYCTLLWLSLVLLLFILPETSIVYAGGSGTGSKVVPVKQIFGVGIGYQKVTHYKPVLVFSRHRPPKKRRPRRPGWGWKKAKGWKSYAPVHIQHHVHKEGRNTPHHRHGGWYYSKMPSRQRHEEYNDQRQGWSGWRPRGRPAYKAHSHRSHGGHKYRESKEGGYDYQNEGSSHPIIGGGDDYVDEYDNRRPHHPSSSNYYYGNPYSGAGNYEEDHGGYESEIKNQVLTPLTFPPSNVPMTTTNPPPPSAFPFTEPPKSDSSVTNIHRDFLRNHLKNFQQFQEYQRSTSSEDLNQPQHSSLTKENPVVLSPPGPNYSTMDLMNADSVKVEDADVQYPLYDDPPDDYYATENWPGSRDAGSENYENTYEQNSAGWNGVNKKTMPVSASTTTPNPLIPPPPVVIGRHIPNSVGHTDHSNNNIMTKKKFNVNRTTLSTTPMPKTKFKASPRIDETPNGVKFTRAGFFPSFDQFQIEIK